MGSKAEGGKVGRSPVRKGAGRRYGRNMRKEELREATPYYMHAWNCQRTNWINKKKSKLKCLVLRFLVSLICDSWIRQNESTKYNGCSNKLSRHRRVENQKQSTRRLVHERLPSVQGRNRKTEKWKINQLAQIRFSFLNELKQEISVSPTELPCLETQCLFS